MNGGTSATGGTPVISSTISTYTYTLNCLDSGLPLDAALRSALGFADEVVVVDAGSTDGTCDYLDGLAREHEKLRVVHGEWDYSDINMDWKMKAFARSKCTSGWCLLLDADEVIHEKDYERLRSLPSALPQGVEVVHLPFLDFCGGPDVVDIGIFWKHAFTPNLPGLTHGFHSGNIAGSADDGSADEDSADDGSVLGDWSRSDGCEYVYGGSGRLAQNNLVLMPNGLIRGKDAMIRGDLSKEEFGKAVGEFVRDNVAIYHYSWIDPVAKAKRLVRQKKAGFNWNPFNMKDVPMREEEAEIYARQRVAARAPYLVRIDGVKHPESMQGVVVGGRVT